MTTEQIYSLFLSSAGINTDTRNARPNQIFLALKGDRFNGNLYAKDALKKGCSFAIVDDESVVLSGKFILVDNCLKCLQDLARMHRQTYEIPIIAITGSNGKTTTKELLSSILEKKFKLHATQGNLNNHIGVPLTLLSMKDTNIAIIEMGANHPGEIATLCEIADPDYGIITNIGKAHLEGFGSIEAIIKAKGELYNYIEGKDGKIFINGENDILRNLADEMNLKKVSYFSGSNLQCDGFVIDNEHQMNISISFSNGEKWRTSTKLAGKYNLENILAAASIGKYFNVDEKSIIESIRDYQPDNNRSQIFKTNSNTLLLDAYNANPTSMYEALMNFSDLTAENKMVIIGDMLELGEYSKNEHQTILNLMKELNFNNVFLVGSEFKYWENEYNFTFFLKIEELTNHFMLNKVKDNYVLLKASRGINLEKVVKLL
ncbi:MAG: UDP-N-acetylmuramoyl-tripeptide--D-alanyl-D-alanine ligase [Bacteroidales bacterium]|nr:UDP-N-acetylmuramoyl-tripeptide--D-alanyl-D-alanine ligase [Bacteroidales bacterium]